MKNLISKCPQLMGIELEKIKPREVIVKVMETSEVIKDIKTGLLKNLISKCPQLMGIVLIRNSIEYNICKK